MKIFIDPDASQISSAGDFYKNPCIDKKGCWLPIEVNQQLKSRWCWAAIACSVGAYYDTIHIEQAELVNRLLPDDDTERNINFKLDVALKYINCFSHWTIGKPTFERIQFEINQGRPLGVRLEWFKGGAHYILINGYNSEDGSIFIEDSLHNRSVQDFNQFPDHYRVSGAVWTEIYWTNKLTTNK
jgi:hypothetical protein